VGASFNQAPEGVASTTAKTVSENGGRGAAGALAITAGTSGESAGAGATVDALFPTADPIIAQAVAVNDAKYAGLVNTFVDQIAPGGVPNGDVQAAYLEGNFYNIGQEQLGGIANGTWYPLPLPAPCGVSFYAATACTNTARVADRTENTPEACAAACEDAGYQQPFTFEYNPSETQCWCVEGIGCDPWFGSYHTYVSWGGQCP
jgi:hypothetical protein